VTSLLFCFWVFLAPIPINVTLFPTYGSTLTLLAFPDGLPGLLDDRLTLVPSLNSKVYETEVCSFPSLSLDFLSCLVILQFSVSSSSFGCCFGGGSFFGVGPW